MTRKILVSSLATAIVCALGASATPSPRAIPSPSSVHPPSIRSPPPSPNSSAARGKFKTPKVESTGTGGGIKLFCNGVGPQYPDIANASRRMNASEVRPARRTA